MLLLQASLLAVALCKYTEGGYLFTEKVAGTCDFKYSSAYVYNYQMLGGPMLDNALAIGFGFWVQYITTQPTWTTRLQEFSYVFHFSDNPNSYDFRLISLAIRKEGPDTIVQLFQQDSQIQGPTLVQTLPQPFDDIWHFIYVSYDFSFLKYNLGVYKLDGTPLLNVTKSCPSSLQYCGTTLLPQPFLKREKLELKIVKNAPYKSSTVQGRTFCGNVASFQYYLDVQLPTVQNILAMLYGMNLYQQYSEFRMLAYSGSVVHDFGDGLHGSIEGTTSWSGQSLHIASSLKVVLPMRRLGERNSEGRFLISFWIKATDGINFAIIQSTDNSIVLFEIQLIWYALSNYYFFRIKSDTTTFDLPIQFNKDVWKHYIFLFNYFKYEYSSDQKYVVTVYDDFAAPQQFITVLPIFINEFDSSQLSIGNNEIIPGGSVLQLSNFHIHQGGRLLRNSMPDTISDGCMYSVPSKGRFVCLLCESGKYMQFDETSGTSKCVASAACTGTVDNQRFLCLPKCAPTCATCNAGVPGTCLTCLNNLSISSPNCVCQTSGYLGQTGVNLRCNARQYLGETIVGVVKQTLSVVSSGSGDRSESKLVQFPNGFATIPAVILSIKMIRLTQGASFRIVAGSVTKTTFSLQIYAWGSTCLSDIEVMYLATTQTSIVRITQAEFDTASTLGTGTGERTFTSQVFLTTWDFRFKPPQFLPFFNGLKQTSGTGNLTIDYTAQIGDKIDFNILTDGDNIITNVYYSYLLIPQFLEYNQIFFESTKVFLEVSQIGISKFNNTFYSFKESQTSNFYGLSGFKITNSLKRVEIQEQKMSSTQFQMMVTVHESTTLASYRILILGLEGNCQAMGCATCTLSPASCTSCKEVGRTPAQQCLDCAANYYLDETFACKQCSYFCNSCATAPSNCISCPIGGNRANQPGSKCPCVNGFFDEGVVACSTCDWRCDTCETSVYNCLTCKGSNRDVEIQCKCKDKFYELPNNVVCQNCVEPCDKCDSTGCLTCLGNRVINQSKKCICQSGSNEIPDTWYCETCDSAEVEITLSQNTEKLTIKFIKSTVQFYLPEYSRLNKNRLCIQLIKTDTLLRYGLNSECEFVDGNIEITFGEGALVNEKEVLSFNPDIFRKSECTAAIKNLIKTDVKTVEGMKIPEFKILAPVGEYFICKEITFEITDLKYVGKRALSQIQWQLVGTLQNADLQAKIIEKIDEANLQNSMTLTFDSEFFPKYQTFTFQVNVQSFLALWNTQQYVLSTVANAQPYINTSRTYIHYNYLYDLVIAVDVFFEQCKSSQIFSYSENMTLSWSQVSSNPTEIIDLLPAKVTQEVKELNQYLRLPPHSGMPDAEYVIRASLKFNDTKVAAKTETTPAETEGGEPTVKVIPGEYYDIIINVDFTIKVQYVGLVVVIEGGDRVIGVSQELPLSALTWDGSVPVSSYNSDSSIELEWSCKYLDKAPCELPDGNPLELPPNQSFQLIEGSFFSQGMTYLFTVKAKKDFRTASFTARVICSFSTIESIYANYPISIQIRDIDILQPITFEFKPTDGRLQNYNYSYNVIYDDQVVYTKILQYPKTTIRLVDALPNPVSLGGCVIQLIQKGRDAYKMANLPIPLNAPPRGGYLEMKSESGMALSFIFSFTVREAEDQDMPIQYRLGMYLSMDYFLEDIQKGTNINQFVLTEYQYSPTFNIRLPSGLRADGRTTAQVVVVITMKDSRGATSNITQPIIISRSYKLWSQYSLTIEEFQSTLQNLTTVTEHLAGAIETVCFYTSLRFTQSNLDDLKGSIKWQYRLMNETRSPDPEVQATVTKILHLFNQSLFHLDIVENQTEAYVTQIGMIDGRIQSIKELLNQQLILIDDREKFGILDSQLQIDNYRSQLVAIFKEYNKLQDYSIDKTHLAELNKSLADTALKFWNIKNPAEALKISEFFSDELNANRTIEDWLGIYNDYERFIHDYTIEEAFQNANLSFKDLQMKVDSYHNQGLKQLKSIFFSMLSFCEINGNPIQLDGTVSSVKVELNTADQVIQKFTKRESNSSIIGRILQASSFNMNKLYYVGLIRYNVNPYMATNEYISLAGPYAFDLSFPLYHPILQEVQEDGSMKELTEVSGFNFSIEFVIPNHTLKQIQEYTCAQKITFWNSSNSECVRTIEYSSTTYQYKFWCTCPQLSETIPIRMYHVKPEAIIKPKLFSWTTFVDFRIGHFLIGATGALLVLALLGFVMDKAEDGKQKLVQQELEEMKMDILNYNRRRKHFNDQVEEARPLNKHEIDVDEIQTQTEPQPVECHKDLDIKDWSFKLFVTGIIKLQELLAVLLFYDFYTLRPIRFLAIYMKFIVMLALSGLLWNKQDLYQSYGVTLAFSELSTLIVKIVKAQLSGRVFQMSVGMIVTLAILVLAYYDILSRAFGQEAESLELWLIYYSTCVGANFLILDPIWCFCKLLLYPWCLKQIETSQETPILYLIYFLITQQDLKTFYKRE